MGICQEANLSVYFPWVAAALGAAYIQAGRVADAVPLLTQAIAMERVDVQALCRLYLGESQALAGHLEEAHALAERAHPQILGQGEGLAVVIPCLLALQRFASRCYLAEKPQGIRLVAPFLVRTGER